MKRLWVILFAVLAASAARSDLIVAYNTFGNLGTESNEPAASTAANITASDLNSVGIVNAANGNRFGGSGWASNTLPIDVTNDYIQLTLTANSGFTFDLTDMVFQWDRSATGPSNVILRTSVDGFASDVFLTGPLTASLTTNSVALVGLTNLSSVTLRFYGDDSSSAAGTGGFDTTANANNLIINGLVIPEPATMGLVALGAAALALRGRRRRSAHA